MTAATMKQLKQIYINSRLHPLPVATPARLPAPREWIFSQGDRWLRLTPPRLRRLAIMLGLEDPRVGALLHEVRRWHPHPEHFCRLLGVEEVVQTNARNYIPVVCPNCDNVHYPHPEDALRPCADCAAKAVEEDPYRRRTRDAEKRRDARARERLLRKNPAAFDEGRLSPNWRTNKSRRLERDWDNAVNRILLGRPYRAVAREFDCSVGLLHRKVSEARHWEWN